MRDIRYVSEISLQTNIMHEILYYCWRSLKKPTIAVCPTSKYESKFGFDVMTRPGDKLLLFQFKAYSYDYSRNKVTDKFQLDFEQHSTLLTYPRGCAFYVFPDYREHRELMMDKNLEFTNSKERYRILRQTWLVDSHDIPNGLIIERSDLTSNRVSNIYWKDLLERTSRSELGIKIIGTGEQTRLVSPDNEPIGELKIPSGWNSFLLMRK